MPVLFSKIQIPTRAAKERSDIEAVQEMKLHNICFFFTVAALITSMATHVWSSKLVRLSYAKQLSTTSRNVNAFL